MAKRNHEIEGIYCDAKNCVYNVGDCRCNAGHVSIGTKNACSTSETLCGTFTLENIAE